MRKLTIIFSVILGTGIAIGSTTIQAKAAKSPVENVDKASAKAPNAMQHMVKGPTVDIEALRDPFASYLALVASRGRQALAERQARLASRKHEELENFNLATLNLVATMRMGKDLVAMVEDSTGRGYIVRRGNYMGKNNGRIKKITDSSLQLVEQIANPAGDIVDRQVTLTLKEVNQ